MKARPNKLDPYAARLDEWELGGKTLDEMREQLKLDGCSVAVSSLSEYLARRRRERMERELFAQIASGARMNRELDAAYKENPEPGVERLMRVSQTIIASLQVKGAADAKMLSLANTMQQTLLNYLTGQTRAEIERRKLDQGERKLALLEKKAAQADAAEKVLGQNISSEEQAARLREIFKK